MYREILWNLVLWFRLYLPRGVLVWVLALASLFAVDDVLSENRNVWIDATMEPDRRVTALLKKFNLNAGRTILMLSRTGAYISGSAVLTVIYPGLFEPGDLDFYVPKETSAELAQHLRRSGGWRRLQKGEYGLVNKRPFAGYRKLPLIEDVVYWYNESQDMIINVIVTSTPSALPAILAFHSTVVMNVIAYCGVLSFYRDLTVRKTGWINIKGRGISQRDRRWLKKYEDRGFSLYRDSRMNKGPGDHVCGVAYTCGQSRRSILDGGVGYVPFMGYRDEEKGEVLKSIEEVLEWRAINMRCHGFSGKPGGWVKIKEGKYKLY